MFTSSRKLAALVAALVTFVVTPNIASADPGKGLRWSDFAWGPSSRTQPMRTMPYYPAAGYSYSPSALMVVPSTPSTTATPTISIRGSDGVVRVFPVVGGVVQQIPTQSTITVRDADGVLRTYPVISESSTGGSSGMIPTVVVPCPRR